MTSGELTGAVGDDKIVNGRIINPYTHQKQDGFHDLFFGETDHLASQGTVQRNVFPITPMIGVILPNKGIGLVSGRRGVFGLGHVLTEA